MTIFIKYLNILKKIKLENIVWLYVGGLITITINWIIFKDPKKVTAPGVTTFLATCTFTLALYSALQVKKWLDGKVNEAAFKQTQLILEAISKIHMSSRLILEDCKSLTQTDMVSALSSYSPGISNNATTAFKKLNKNMMNQIKICKETNFQLQVLIYELPMWNISIKNKRVKKDILDIVAATKLFLEKCDEIEEQTNKKNMHYIMTLASEINDELHGILFNQLDKTLTKNYHDIFSPITSPVKKDD